MKRTALITGASSGFGLEFARNFAKDGHGVVLVARSADKLEQLATELRSQYQVPVWVMPCDLSRMEAIEALYADLQKQEIQIDFLVNNAGFGDFAFFHEADWQKIEQMIDLNIKALTKLSHLFAKEMKARGFGRILQVASTAAFQPGPLMAVYFATKAYVLYLGEAMNNELQGTGVSVTNLCPGPAETGFQQVADLADSKLIKGKKIPSAKEIADEGYKHLMKGSMTVIPGLANKIGANMVRFVPRKWVLSIVRKVQEKA